MQHYVHIMHNKRKRNVHTVQSLHLIASDNVSDMRLAEIRAAKGLSQDDLAEMVGVDRSTISRAESMNKTAKISTYIKCAEALGVSLSDLFADSMDPTERDLLQLFRVTPEAMKPHFVDLMRAAKSQTD
ncbi:helix-turn-helix transcriptional regulator [Rhodobacteraceae bacterium]|nr:helix-turn-helix transcriptional regulator [Paracoccaceae bacterium]